MNISQTSRFRSCGPVGRDACNDLEFNELGGTRIPGSTGSKVVGHTVYTQVARNGPQLPVAAETAVATEQAPASTFEMLSAPEREALWQQIQKGLKYEDAARILKQMRSGSAFEGGLRLSLRLLGENRGPEERHHLTLLAASLEMPGEAELLNELRDLYAKYDALCINEYLEFSSHVASVFNAVAKEKNSIGWRAYQDLRPLYRQAGYTYPPKELNKIKNQSFMGIKIAGGVHEDLATILEAAEAKLIGDFVIDPETTIGGFWPRAISDDKSNLSNHAIGKAVDIHAGGNPQFSAAEAKTIDEVLDWLKAQQKRGVPWLQVAPAGGPWRLSEDLVGAMTPAEGIMLAYNRMKDNSGWLQCFLREMLPLRQSLKKNAAGVKSFVRKFEKRQKLGTATAAEVDQGEQAKEELEVSQNLEKLIGALGRATPPVKPEVAAKKGILRLAAQVFVALWEAGARSGLEYNHKKDAMHFEVPPKGKSKQKK